MILSLLLATAIGAATCSGADPALMGAAVKNITNDSGTNHYALSGTVTNRGSIKQASNVLQFVDIFIDGQKLNSIGIPPLKPGQSYTFGWTYNRSVEAGQGTTTVHFQLRSANAMPNAAQDCNAGNDGADVTF